MEDASIAKSVRGCIELFQTLASLLSPLANASYQTALIAIIEEEPRFKIWSGNMGAHASGERSLQYRLRDASHLQKQVLALLADLSELLEDALAILCGSKVPWDQIEDDEILADEPDFLQDSNSDDSELPTTELEQIASNVPDTINCLLRLSVAIRNPAPHDRFAVSAPIDVSHYEPFDIQHVQAKFQKIDSLLAQRLGHAISRRRQYFKYRENYQLKLMQGMDLTDQANGKSTIASSIPGYTKSTGFGNALSTVDEDVVSDSGISQTSFASSVTDTERLRIPPPPESAESGPFECPFCYMIITATNRVSWKQHVFADLRPYVCLSKDCLATEKWFARRHEWITHEVENHWKLYVCPYSCKKSFQSRSKCVEHVEKSHPSAIPRYQLDTVINLNSRPIRAEDGIACPICKESLDSVKKYRRHVGRHQEQLAIFALPSIQNQYGRDGDESDPSQSDVDSEGVGTADGGVRLEELQVNDGRESTPEAEPAAYLATTTHPSDNSVISIGLAANQAFQKAMDDLFSPYWTCPMPECEDNEIGWPTEEELDRHIAEKHSNTSDMFECLFKPCSYKSKLKSNYIQHLKSAHGWKEKASATNNSSGSIYNTPMSVDSALRNHLNAGRLQSRTDTLDYRSGNQSGRASRTVPAIGYFNELYDDYEEEQTQKVARSRLYAEVERPSHKWLEGAGINKSFGGSYKESPIPSRQSRKAAPQPSHRRSEGFVDQQPFDEDDFLGDDELEVAPYQRRTAINRPRPSSSVPYNQHDYNIVPAGNQDHGSSIYRPGLGEFGGIGFKENDKYFNTLQYQEYTSGRPPMPLTAEALRKASKREEPASNSRSTTSSSTGSHKESDYNKNSNTTGLTIQSSAAHNDDFTIKVSGLAVVKVPGTHIEGDGGEITFTSNRGAAAFGGQSHLLNEDQERKITYDPLLAHEDQEYAPYDPSLAASNFY